ncbi:MAG: guanylate kinase [Candidatus Saccharimonadales bacterium]
MDNTLANKILSYQPAEDTIRLIKSTPILFLVGPTGAGKDAIKEKLITTGEYHHIISHTTRTPRFNEGILEKDGLEYHFIDKVTAEKMLDDKSFIEAKVYSGNLYGTSVREIEQALQDSKIAMTDIEVQGIAEYKALDPSIMAVFLIPPDFNTWQKRLKLRYGKASKARDERQRLKTALNEIEQFLLTGYYIPIINDDLDESFKKIQALTKSKKLALQSDPKAIELAKRLASDIQNHLDNRL